MSSYNPLKFEHKYNDKWKNSSAMHLKDAPCYSIMLPPPNVTGSLHMGHAFQQVIMDLLCRFHRASNFSVLWQPGTDHAGIATQMVVERKLLAENIEKDSLGRDKFIEKVWDWKQLSEARIIEQLSSLGSSLNWERHKFTLDPELSNSVQEAFIRFYNDGLIYQGTKLVNWDPVLKTAISDLEVNNVESDGTLWHIKYMVDDGSELIVATTRPETMLGDTAVAVNPKDPRYKNIIGKEVILPLTNRKVPIIADDYVEQEFGTGVVKITPAHDFNDYEIGLRHKLPIINILNDDATLNSNVPERFRGLSSIKARQIIVSELSEDNLIIKEQAHKMMIPKGDRTGAVLEPYLTKQWFLKVKGLAAAAKQAGDSNELEFFPSSWKNTYDHWLSEPMDWCISRQLWWGHRIPIWYDETGRAYCGKDESDIRAKYQLGTQKLEQDCDVLDTWFSSALWPLSTLGWPNKTEELEKYYPTSVLVTGFDIIFFWAARMVMFGLYFTGKVPFKKLYIHGLINDHTGMKMSKSKGNVIDPLDLVNGIELPKLLEKRTTGLMQPEMKNKIMQLTKKQFPQGIDAYGVDPLRFTLLWLASGNRHIKFDMKRLESSRNFCNKLWNAAKLVDQLEIYNTKETCIYSTWLLNKWHNCKLNVKKHLNDYRFDLLIEELYSFTWNIYCDWGLEIAKALKNDQEHDYIKVVKDIFKELLVVLHPVIPYLTEELWSKYIKIDGLVFEQQWPEQLVTSSTNNELQEILDLISTIRNLRSMLQISPKVKISMYCPEPAVTEILKVHQSILSHLSGIGNIYSQNRQQGCIKVIFNNSELFIEVNNVVDLATVKKHFASQVKNLKIKYDKLSSRTSDPNFVQNVPKHVLEKSIGEQDKLEHQISEFKNIITSIS